ncbi:MAG: hypothetical protein JNJ58_01605 [Chitinophagaceae bacterium]|nr:hypothetical protein [Chitinophagaceae bacterium]
MKHTPLKLAAIMFALAGTLIFASCQRNGNSKDSDTSSASDNALSEFAYNDALNIADDASDKQTGDNLGSYKTASACATVTHDTLSTPKLLTIDFGPTNCLCNDGRYRRGKILVSYTGKYRDAGHIHTITFDQYFVNDNQIMGTKTVENMGLNANNQSYFNINVNGTIVKSTGDTITRLATRTRTWIQGEATQTWMDDVYEITGSGSGTHTNGSYTMNITQPLIKEVGCKWFTAGKMDIQPSGKPLRSIDFGTGACDNQATVTINGNTFNIYLN